MQGEVSLRKMLARAARFKRIAVVLVLAVCVPLAVFLVLAMLPAVTVPAAAPVGIAGRELGEASDLFGGTPGGNKVTGAEIAQAGRDSGLTCKDQKVPDLTSAWTTTTPPPAAVPDPDASTDPEAATTTPEPPQPQLAPILVNKDGSISRSDAKALIDPVPPKTSALIAQVWFLYRLAGIGGDWSTFTTAYDAAGLRGDDEAEDAPLKQVQALNHAGVPVEGYRLTAAALAASGLYTGRFSDPHPGYRKMLVAELMTSCLESGTGLEGQRAKLPPASVTSSAPMPELTSQAESPEPVTEPGS